MVGHKLQEVREAARLVIISLACFSRSGLGAAGLRSILCRSSQTRLQRGLPFNRSAVLNVCAPGYASVYLCHRMSAFSMPVEALEMSCGWISHRHIWSPSALSRACLICESGMKGGGFCPPAWCAQRASLLLPHRTEKERSTLKDNVDRLEDAMGPMPGVALMRSMCAC